ncbi:HNH endonuclease signature motif containing protein [Cellulomonas sp. PSBB021]|uniref:HNH endonuclease signature motif containing protein n=1 Tax=Cellulomonas sp. PSBB021 TaxID=2003551 RepID=UPI000B8D7B74|nr:HNH endonuclease signature motif containing protein [Cellulomonas sp. PSBB021]ASR56437.1 hypothetical protein CBP52_16530 [Cellulomonas sp. PSBB021]
MFETPRDEGALAVVGSGARSVAGSAVGSAVARGGAEVAHRLGAVVEELVALATATRDAAGWTGAERARVLGALDRVPGLVSSVRAPVLVAQQRAAARVGAEREFADQRAQAIAGTRGQADRQVRAAHALTRLDGVRDAVHERRMLEPHVDALARVLDTASSQVDEFLTSSEGQRRVVELAHGADARQFARDLAVLAATHDQQGADDAREASRRARFLHLTHAADGTFLRGRLDPLAGRALQAALDATGHRPDDDRAPEQARADALTALARHALGASTSLAAPALDAAPGAPGAPAVSGGYAAPGAPGAPGAAGGREDVPDGAQVVTPGVVPHVSLVVPAATWHAVREQARRRGAVEVGAEACGADGARRGAAAEGRVEPAAAAERRVEPARAEDGTVVSSHELAAALCDCAMTRVVMDERGVPLDVGRTRRMFTPAQRRAVVVRDQVCAWNGCSVAPAYCQVHHIAWWHRDGGRSDLANALLLCDFHHHEVHRLDLTVVREPVGRQGRAESAERPGTPTRARYTFSDRTGRPRNSPPRPPRPPRPPGQLDPPRPSVPLRV